MRAVAMERDMDTAKTRPLRIHGRRPAMVAVAVSGCLVFGRHLDVIDDEGVDGAF